VASLLHETHTLSRPGFPAAAMTRGKRDEDAYAQYVTAKLPWLRRIAYLLCQDWHRADDLVQTSIAKLYINWLKAAQVAHLDGYVRAILINTFLAEQRTHWWKRVVLYHDGDQDTKIVGRAGADSDAAIDLRRALALLPPRQRAIVVLRYYCELSIEETAAELGCSTGNPNGCSYPTGLPGISLSVKPKGPTLLRIARDL
jgi:RNA polymerase sigma factor (sigma-70 family)